MKTFFTRLRVLLLLGGVLTSLSSVFAQDIHFSQFANSPLNLSPGLSGVFGGDLRAVVNYRRQWRSIPVPYTTVSGSVEQKFYYRNKRYDQYVTAGFLFNYDRQGSLHLTSLHAGIPLALTLPAGRRAFVNLAVLPAFGQRSFGTENISFGEQFIDCFYSPSNPWSEAITRSRISYFDLSAGLNFRFQAEKKRSRLDVGAGAYHLNRPQHNFWPEGSSGADETRLHRRIGGHAIGLVQIRPSLDITAQAQFQKQGAYREIVYGLGARFLVDHRPYKELAVQVGVDFRHRYQDAIIPHLEVYWKTWTLGLSYDLNAWNEIQTITRRRGGPELSLIYRLYHTKLPFNSCGTF